MRKAGRNRMKSTREKTEQLMPMILQIIVSQSAVRFARHTVGCAGFIKEQNVLVVFIIEFCKPSLSLELSL